MASIFWEYSGEEKRDINVFDIYPQHKADGMSFDNDYDVGVMDYMIEKDYMSRNAFIGMIHSHCNAGVFFSGPDMQELETNCKAFPIYLSVITNNQGQYVAKTAKYIKKIGVFNGTKTYKDDNGNTVNVDFSEEIDLSKVDVTDWQVKKENLTSGDPEFDAMVNKIIREYDERKKKEMKNRIDYGGYNSLWSFNDHSLIETGVVKKDKAMNNYEDADVEVVDLLLKDFLSDLNTGDFDNMTLEQVTKGRSYNSTKHRPEKFLDFVNEYTDIDNSDYWSINVAVKLAKAVSNPFCNKLVKEWDDYVFMQQINNGYDY